jgi:hypothetical protein
MAPGDTKSVQVPVTARSSVPATVARVVPALASFLSVTPSSVGALPQGATQLVTLSFAIPADTPFQTVDGTLHLDSGTATIARPLPITLNVWPSLPVGSVRFNYPPVLISQVVDSETVVIRHPGFTPGEEGPFLSLVVDHNPQSLSAADYYDGDPGPDLSDATASSITVAGRPSLRFVPASTLAGAVVVVVPGTQEFIRVTDSGVAFQADGSFDAVLSNLHF